MSTSSNNPHTVSNHDDASWFDMVSQIERGKSAPPNLEKLTSNSIFAFQSKYSHLFGDIRCEQDYEIFYKNHNDPSKLPPPIEKDPFFLAPEVEDVTSRLLNFGLNHVTTVETTTVEKKFSKQIQRPVPVQQEPTPTQTIIAPIPKTKESTQSLYAFNGTHTALPNGSEKSYSSVLKKQNGGENVIEQQIVEEPPVVHEKLTPSKRQQVKYTTVRECIGKIYSLSKDQYGCRFLQKKLEDNNPADCEAIFIEVYDHIVELMTDPFGNYLCQKLVEYCDDKQKTAIIKSVAPDLVSISMNMHGTRAVQRLIECLSTQEQVKLIIEALRHSVVPLIRDLNGNHVIQRCLQKLSTNDKQFIYDAVAGRCVQVATHKHGCCVLQRCIDFASGKQKAQLIKEIVENALTLVQNPFGNYVVQYVLDLGIESVTVDVIKKFMGSIDILSMNKFSSNVIEQCLRLAPTKNKNEIIDELLSTDKLYQVLQDSYGNYVIQTAISVSDNKQYERFNELIRPMLHLVKNTPYGKKIEARLNRKTPGRGGINSRGAERGGFSKRGERGSKKSDRGYYPRR